MSSETELPLLGQFFGAVKTRIADRQKHFWSRIIGAGFTVDDIESIHPEGNMRFFSMRYSGHTQSFNIQDLNLRELDAIHDWIIRQPGTRAWWKYEQIGGPL